MTFDYNVNERAMLFSSSLSRWEGFKSEMRLRSFKSTLVSEQEIFPTRSIFSTWSFCSVEFSKISQL